MKKLILIIMAAVMCTAFTACKNDGNNGDKDSNNSISSKSEQQSSAVTAEKTPAEKAAELLDTVTFPEMVSKDMDFVEVTLGITDDMVSNHVYYVCGSGAMPDEFGIFIAASEDAAAEIREKIYDRIDYQRDTYTSYAPDEAYKLTDAFCEVVDGNTVIYAVCAENRKAREILS